MPEEYEPPPGFRPAVFRDEDGKGAGEFAAESLGPALQQKDKSLWMVKLPAGLSAAELDGMQIPLNTSVSGNGHAPTIARFTANDAEYQVVSVPSSKSGQTLAQPPPGAEMPNFDVFLPASTSKRGKMSRVSRPSHYFTVALAPPAQEAVAPPPEAVLPIQMSEEEMSRVEKAIHARKTPHQQPEHKLYGFFNPAGATADSKQLDAHWKETQGQNLGPNSEEELRRYLTGDAQKDLRKQFCAAVTGAPPGYEDGQEGEPTATEDVTMDEGSVSYPGGGSFEVNDPTVPTAPTVPAPNEEEEEGEADESSSKHHKHRSKEHKSSKDKDQKKHRHSSSSKHSSSKDKDSKDKSKRRESSSSGDKDSKDKSKRRESSSSSKDKSDEHSKKRRSSESKDDRKTKREKKE